MYFLEKKNVYKKISRFNYLMSPITTLLQKSRKGSLLLKKIALKAVVALLAITIFATIAILGVTPIYAHNLPGCD